MAGEKVGAATTGILVAAIAVEDENLRLKMLVAEPSLGGEALKAVIRKNAWSRGVLLVLRWE